MRVLPSDISRISVPTPFAVGDVNLYFISGARPTLVDTGPRTHDALAALERGLADAGARIQDVDQILVTHQHHDHAGLAADLQKRAGAELTVLAPLDRFLSDFDRAMDRDDQFAVTTMLRHGIEPAGAETLRSMSRAMRDFGAGAEVDCVLAPRQTVVAGDRTLVALPRPGHTPTDTVFVDEREGIMFGGDHLLERISSNPVAVCPLDAADPDAAARSHATSPTLKVYIDSLRATRELALSLVLPGHGEPFEWDPGAIDRRIRMHSERAAQIEGLLNGGSSVADVIDGLWPDLPVKELYLATSEVLGHLFLLESAGRIASVPADGGIRFIRNAPITTRRAGALEC